MEYHRSFFQSIRTLIAEDNIEEAIARLQIFLENKAELKEVLLQSARYAAINKKIQQGIVSVENADLTNNQIRTSLLEVVDECENPSAKSEVLDEDQGLSVHNHGKVDKQINIKDNHGDIYL